MSCGELLTSGIADWLEAPGIDPFCSRSSGEAQNESGFAKG